MKYIFLITAILSLSSCVSSSPEVTPETTIETPASYYDTLRGRCDSMNDEATITGCKTSVETMETNGYKEALQNGEESTCPDGMRVRVFRSPGSLVWCEPATSIE